MVEVQGIRALIEGSFKDIFNLYVPPASSCAPTVDPIFGQRSHYRYDASPLLAHAAEGDTFILGDFNAHNIAWYSSIHDSRGDDVAEAIEN